MAYLNEQQRSKLLDELKNMTFRQAKGRLRRLDKKSRLVYFRNAQGVGRWLTRFELVGLGTVVTLVEENRVMNAKDSARLKSAWELVEVVVEPTPDNRN